MNKPSPSIPQLDSGSHIKEEGENRPYTVILWPPHTQWYAHNTLHVHVHTLHKITIKFEGNGYGQEKILEISFNGHTIIYKEYFKLIQKYSRNLYPISIKFYRGSGEIINKPMGLGSTLLMPRQRDFKASYESHVGQNIDRGHEFGEMWVRTMLYVLSEMGLLCGRRRW